MSIVLNTRFLGVVFVLEVILLAVLLVFAAGTSVEAGTCNGHYWSAVEDETLNAYYGAYGANRIQDASVEGSDDKFFVNSTWVVYNADNFAEVGWIWRGGWNGPREMTVWATDGDWDVDYHDTLTVGTSQSFETRRVSSSGSVWKWYAGGDLKKTKTLDMGHGNVGAQQERNYACDNVEESHWWGLQRMKSIGTRSDWEDMNITQESDPDYCIDSLSDTAFKVRKGSGTSC